MKTFLFRSLIGIFFGSFIAVILININIGLGESEMIDGSLLLKNSIASMLCGWFFAVSPLYFEIKKLKLHQQTILHFLTVITLYFILAVTVEWIPFTIKYMMISLLSFIAVYVIFWFVFYFYYKNLVQKLNEDLKNI